MTIQGREQVAQMRYKYCEYCQMLHGVKEPGNDSTCALCSVQLTIDLIKERYAMKWMLPPKLEHFTF